MHFTPFPCYTVTWSCRTVADSNAAAGFTFWTHKNAASSTPLTVTLRLLHQPARGSLVSSLGCETLSARKVLSRCTARNLGKLAQFCCVFGCPDTAPQWFSRKIFSNCARSPVRLARKQAKCCGAAMCVRVRCVSFGLRVHLKVSRDVTLQGAIGAMI